VSIKGTKFRATPDKIPDGCESHCEFVTVLSQGNTVRYVESKTCLLRNKALQLPFSERAAINAESDARFRPMDWRVFLDEAGSPFEGPMH
jgi:hypothetical protein